MADTHRLLIAFGADEVSRFAALAAARGFACREAVVWEGYPGDPIAGCRLTSGTSIGDPAALGTESLEIAGQVVARLVASGWWEVDDLNVARLLRDLLVREIGNLVLAIRRIELVLDETDADALIVPSPLKQSYYLADGMMHDAARLVVEARGIPLQILGGFGRGAHAALLEAGWRWGLRLTRNQFLKQAALGRGAGPSPASPGERGTICVGPCWGAELQSHRPVSDALRERGWRLVFFEIPSYYSRTDWRGDVLPEGVSPIGRWADGQAAARAIRISDEICRRLADRAALERHRSVFDAGGGSLLGSAYLGARLRRLATTEARLAVALHTCAQRMCEVERPKVVLCLKGEGPEVRGIMAGAQDAGVSVAFMPHGLNADDPRWDDVQADVALAYGEQFAGIIRRRTAGRTEAVVVGTPKHDAFFRAAESGDVAAARAAFGLPEKAVWVGVATTDRPDQDLANARAVAAFAREHGDAGVLVKTHPRRSEPETIQAFEQAAGPTGVVLSKVDTMQALWCCDVVVTGVSSAAIEAFAAGRPVVYVGPPADDIHGYVAAGIPLLVASPDDLAPALDRLLADPSAVAGLVARGYEFAQYRVGPLDGRAAERAVAQIERLAQLS